MKKPWKNDRDANEREIIEFLRAGGCIVWQMTREDGFDLLVICPRTGVHIVEVKNPARKWTLTDNEKKKQAEVESVGGKYEIIEHKEEARYMVKL